MATSKPKPAAKTPAKAPAAKAPAKAAAKAPAKKANSAFLKPVQPDEALAAIVGEKAIPRTEVTKKVWDYIKKHKLQDEKKRTIINADAALKPIFGSKKSVTMFELTKLISAHLS